MYWSSLHFKVHLLQSKKLHLKKSDNGTKEIRARESLVLREVQLSQHSTYMFVLYYKHWQAVLLLTVVCEQQWRKKRPFGCFHQKCLLLSFSFFQLRTSETFEKCSGRERLRWLVMLCYENEAAKKLIAEQIVEDCAVVKTPRLLFRQVSKTSNSLQRRTSMGWVYNVNSSLLASNTLVVQAAQSGL